MAVHAYTLSAGVVEAGGSGAQSYSQLPSEFKANLTVWDPVSKMIK